MQLKELFNYKNQLMQDLCSNPEVVWRVTGNAEASVPNHDLPYTQVYPYEFVPETVSDGKTFICFDIDITRAPSKTVYIPVIYIFVFTHKSLLRAPDGGVLIDSIAGAIDTMLNGNRFYGLGELELSSVERFVPIADYYGRVMAYTAKDFNRASGKQETPANRNYRRR